MVSYLINKLLGKVFGLVLTITINFIVTPIVEIYYVVIVTNVSFYLYNASTMMLSVVDFLSDMFRMFAGVREGLKLTSLEHMYTGLTLQSNDLLIQMLMSKQVAGMFVSVLAVGLFLIMLCSMVAIIKQEFNTEKANRKSQIIGAALKSYINMIFVPVICLFGVVLANEVLQLIDLATGGSDDLTISGVIFSTATVDAYYDDELCYMVSLANPLESSVNGGLSAAISTLIDNITDLIKMKEETAGDLKTIVGAIFGFRSPLVKIVNDDSIYVFNSPSYSTAVAKTPGSDESRLVVSAYKEFVTKMYTSVKAHDLKNPDTANLEVAIGGYKAWLSGDYVKIKKEDGTGTEYSVKTNSWSRVFAEYGDELIGVSENCYRVYYNGYQVTADFHPAKINYLIIFFAAGAVIKALFGAIIGLMMRVYQGTALYIIMPLVIGMSPLDEGAAFNNWKTQFISQVVGAYSAIIAVNLFLMLCGWFIKIDLSYMPTNQILQSMNLADVTYLSISFILNNNVLQGLFRMLFIITGALMIKDFSKIVADIFGIIDVMGEGDGFAKNLKSEFGKMTKFGVGVGAAGAALTAKGAGGIANKVTQFKGKVKEHKSNMDLKKKILTSRTGGLSKEDYIKNRIETGGAGKKRKRTNRGIQRLTEQYGDEYDRFVQEGKDDWKNYKKGQKAVKKNARKYARSKVGFFSSLTSGNLRAYKNTQFLAQKAAMEEFDAKQGAYRAALDSGDQHAIGQAKRAMNDTKNNIGGFLSDEAKNSALAESVIDAEEAKDMNLKTNMMWGANALTDMIPGLKTLRELKSDTESARKAVAKKNDALGTFADALEEMTKDNRKEDDKAHHKSYHAKEALLNAKALAYAIEQEANRAVNLEKKSQDDMRRRYARAAESGNREEMASLEWEAKQRGYGPKINGGQMTFANRPEPIKIDPSKMKDCKSEKEIMALIKKEADELAKKNDKMQARMLKAALANYKAQADKK